MRLQCKKADTSWCVQQERKILIAETVFCFSYLCTSTETILFCLWCRSVRRVALAMRSTCVVKFFDSPSWWWTAMCSTGWTMSMHSNWRMGYSMYSPMLANWRACTATNTSSCDRSACARTSSISSTIASTRSVLFCFLEGPLVTLFSALFFIDSADCCMPFVSRTFCALLRHLRSEPLLLSRYLKSMHIFDSLTFEVRTARWQPGGSLLWSC